MTAISVAARPAGMREVTLLMCLFSLLGLAVIRPQGLEASVVYVTSGVFVVISFLVLWQFWNGRNWARWLVLAYSALSLPNLFLLSSVPTVAKFLLAAEAAL